MPTSLAHIHDLLRLLTPSGWVPGTGRHRAPARPPIRHARLNRTWRLTVARWLDGYRLTLEAQAAARDAARDTGRLLRAAAESSFVVRYSAFGLALLAIPALASCTDYTGKIPGPGQTPTIVQVPSRRDPAPTGPVVSDVAWTDTAPEGR